MKYYSYQYETVIRFDHPVTRHHFKLRCIPCRCDFQNLECHKLYMEPHDSLEYDADCFGNEVQYGYKTDAHDLFVFISCGEVSQIPYAICDEKPKSVYMLPSALTMIDEPMVKFYHVVRLDGGDNLDKAMALCNAVHQWMDYLPGSTVVNTTAVEAFKKEKGVCQDFAHVLIALCRYQGIPARYVNGFITGQGETHAWVEIYSNGEWRGVDPTNNVLIEYGYVKLAHGRDAADCAVNRGVFTGCAQQHIEVKVIVKEIKEI